MNAESASPPDGEPLFAQEAIGRTILIGLTFCDASGAPERQEQLHGVIADADPRDGFLIRRSGARDGDTYRLPSHPSAFQRASPGVYRLGTTGEEVIDPDFLTSWTIQRPADS